ncbi:hypothetical protein L208DRAFT_693712 [Tricholoma matsutake]|nr:hypothetical protein L208DRAFT_693712 [Tricholoma matsutake 945]
MACKTNFACEASPLPTTSCLFLFLPTNNGVQLDYRLSSDADHCRHRFRILLIGKSGVGKSSLINHIFSVEYDTVSHREHGICDISKEIMSPQNPCFVVHDSQGFEPGVVDNLNLVKTFPQQRDNGELNDQVHAIWLCIQVPFAGGRVLERKVMKSS